MLFGCYRRGDANEPDAYVRAVASVLALYDADLIREVTDPRTGIQNSEKFAGFMPNSGELKIYCDGIASRRERLKRLGDRKFPDPDQQRLPAARGPNPLAPIVAIFVPPGHARYPSLCKWGETADPRMFCYGKSSDGRDGIWVAWHIFDDRDRIITTAGNIVNERVIADILARKQQAAE